MKTLLRRVPDHMFFLSDGLGFHILPKHFYTPIPDYNWLRQNLELWAKPAPMLGITWEPERQLAWLKQICEPYYGEVRGRMNAGGFGSIEGQVLHCFIRTKAPERILEIGGGNSTGIMLGAIERNRSEGRQEFLTSVEPRPRRDFKPFIRKIRHIPMLCQAVPREVFGELRAGDLLFVDSSHAVKVGSDVLRICLEIIPSLPPGVFIHIHDVFLPYLYPRDALTTFLGWQETSLVLALLTNNSKLEILACMSGLHYQRPAQMVKILTDYVPQPNHYGFVAGEGHFPSSLWLLKK